MKVSILKRGTKSNLFLTIEILLNGEYIPVLSLLGEKDESVLDVQVEGRFIYAEIDTFATIPRGPDGLVTQKGSFVFANDEDGCPDQL